MDKRHSHPSIHPLILILILILPPSLHGQNLVPNPGFESPGTIFCGIYGPIDFAASVTNWYAPTTGSPDLFSTQLPSSCWNHQPNSTYPGPICLKGSCLPFSGNVFAGFTTYTVQGLNQREYLQVALTMPMTPGTAYCVQFYVSLADNTEKYTDRIGALFTTTPLTSNSDQVLSGFTPQISADTFINDKVNWSLISGSFTATEAFQYLTIGNFYDDASTVTYPNPGGGTGPGCYGAYYFLDDILVTPCAVGISDPRNPSGSIMISHNPVGGYVQVSHTLQEAFHLEIFDITGRRILTERVNGSAVLSVSNFQPGLYIHRVTQPGKGFLHTGKLLLEAR